MQNHLDEQWNINFITQLLPRAIIPDIVNIVMDYWWRFPETISETEIKSMELKIQNRNNVHHPPPLNYYRFSQLSVTEEDVGKMGCIFHPESGEDGTPFFIVWVHPSQYLFLTLPFTMFYGGSFALSPTPEIRCTPQFAENIYPNYYYLEYQSLMLSDTKYTICNAGSYHDGLKVRFEKSTKTWYIDDHKIACFQLQNQKIPKIMRKRVRKGKRRRGRRGPKR